MNNIIKSTLALGLVVTTAVLATSPALAEIHPRSKDIVVVTPGDLPTQTQVSGDSLFLHSDNSGRTYLYVEQQQGARLSVFDVTDPARIKLVVSTPLTTGGAFDFVRPLGDHAELVYFRDNQKEAVLDLHKTARPVFRFLSTVADFGTAEPLGASGLLVSNQAPKYVPTVARDYQVVDITASEPMQLAAVTGVKHWVTNHETGTTFVLGSNGLTVVRSLSAEYAYQVHRMQLQGN